MRVMQARLASAWRASTAAAWWRGKAVHERLVYGALAAAAAAAFLWLALWRPLADWQAQEAARLERAQELLEWVSANEARARAAGASGKGAAAEPSALIPTITQAAGAAGVSLSRLQPESGGGVSVLMQQQPFDRVIALVARLQERRGLIVERASMDAHRTPGFVDAQLRIDAAR